MSVTLTWTKDGIHANDPDSSKPLNLARAQAEAKAYIANHPNERDLIERSIAALLERSK